jgi:hypothetical protein
MATGVRVREMKEEVSHAFQLHSVVDHNHVMRASMSCCHAFHLWTM